MTSEIILKVKVNDFDFVGFLTEIRRNLSLEMDEFSIPIYLNKSEEKDMYVSIQGTEHMYLTPEFIYEDIRGMERCIYITFMHSSGNIGYGVGACGNGSEINFNNLYLGDFFHDDCGFLIESNDGCLTFKKAHYNLGYRGEGEVFVVKSAGDFEYNLYEFLDNYIYK